MQTPLLWCTIILNFTNADNVKEEISLFERHIERSGAAPLNIIIHLNDEDTFVNPLQDSVLLFLQLTSPRWKTIAVLDTNPAVGALVLEQLSNAPLLEKITLEPDMGNMTQHRL